MVLLLALLKPPALPSDFETLKARLVAKTLAEADQVLQPLFRKLLSHHKFSI